MKKSYTKITINGKEYSDINEIPQQYRKLIEDKTQNGLPNFFE